MTTDTTPPQENPVSTPQANSNVPRQKQSFRRRRKRRGPGANPAQGTAPNAAAPNPPQAGSGGNSGPIASPQSSNSPANGTPRNENQPRKAKKRFFKKGSGQGQNNGQNPGQNPGNSQSNGRNARNNGQQRRGSKQRRAPKVFVGPMDHSYRAVNGNYADAPPSTIELQRGHSVTYYNGNGNGNHNGNVNGNINGNGNGNYSANLAGASLDAMGISPVANVLPGTDVPARIYCFIDDLFFIAKIQETARKLGIKVAFVKNDKETVAQMLALPEAERPTLIVLDLNNANAKPLALIPKLKLKLKRATSIVGFLSHLQGELKAKAIEAGCDTVMPRSAFSQTLPNLLRRYGTEVEEDLTQVAEA